MESKDPISSNETNIDDSSLKDLISNPLKNNISIDMKCIICGDRASGIHYKVISCDGCRGFFKRSVRKGIKETCKNNNSCLVNKQNRTSCKICRYNKCIECGMDRSAVQSTKDLQTKNEIRFMKVPNNAVTNYAEKIQQICQCFAERNRDFWKESVIMLSLDLMNKNDKSESPDLFNFKDCKHHNLEKCIVAGDWTRIAKHSFHLVLKWVSGLSYIKNMNESERCILLEDNWPILLIVTLCQFYECHEILKMISMLYFAHKKQDRNSSSSSCNSDNTNKNFVVKTTGTYDITLILYRLRELVFHLQSLRCDSEEFALIKTMGLHYPSSEELKFWGSIAGNYKSAASSFISYICRRSFPPETLYDYSNKISTVMMLLASIKGFSSQKMEIVFSPALNITQPIDRVFWNNIIKNNF